MGRYVYLFGGRWQNTKTNDRYMLDMQLKQKELWDDTAFKA